MPTTKESQTEVGKSVMMKLGYNTNGLAHHEPFAALQLLLDTGYASIAISVDHHFLSPFSKHTERQIEETAAFLADHRLASVIETGARFLLDPNVKHAPTLLDPNSDSVQRRVEFTKYCLDLADRFGSRCVSIWSGRKPPGLAFPEALERLARNLQPILNYAEEKKIDIGFEPEPEMLIDTTGRFERLLHLVDSSVLKLTLDVGHLFCLNEVPIVSYIEKWKDLIVNVHIEDICTGVHEHLMFGSGQIYFPPVIEALVAAGYNGGLHVELSRHSHDAANAVRQSYDFLKPIIEDAYSSQNLS
jgi:sugar phosphate isomerase/epimerase